MKNQVFYIMFIFVLSSCTTVKFTQRNDIKKCIETSVLSDKCSKNLYLTLKSETEDISPDLAFIEFNEKGLPYNTEYVDAVFNNLKDEAKRSDQSLLTIVFIHGWNHNSSQYDENVIEFKKFIKKLQVEESSNIVGPKRKIVGIYLGWQGRSPEFKTLRIISFRNKKQLSIKTGKNLTGILHVLSETNRLNSKNRLVLVGHSFGASVLYSAIKDDIKSDLISRNSNKYVNLVVFLNPAIEAAQFVEIQNLTNKNFPACTPLSFVSFTSNNDKDLLFQFPLAMRLFYFKTSVLDTTSYGMYPDYLKYQLNINTSNNYEKILTPEIFKNAYNTWYGFREGLQPFVIDDIILKSNSKSKIFSWSPVLNVSVNQSFINNHNDIWGTNLPYFLRGFIGMSFSKNNICKMIL